MGGGHGAAAGLSIFSNHEGLCWRAVTAGHEASGIAGNVDAGRYNRPGERTLYMSGSPEGVVAAMARYGDADRTLVRLAVVADRLIDLRDPSACAAIGIDPIDGQADWIAALSKGEEPPSWRVSDRVRAMGAMGLIDRSRHAPSTWHLVLFRWNEPGGALVRVEGPSREHVA